ncbi:MAG: hypothetical protein ACSLE5_12805 [Porticoccaceae bacterium]
MNDSPTSMASPPAPVYGMADTSFQAAGGVCGIYHLVADFYRLMDTLPEATTIRAMPPSDLSEAADNLHRFLCGWLGGHPSSTRKNTARSTFPRHTRTSPLANATLGCCVWNGP